MYKALYRKFRPFYFKDLVGQDVLVKTLKNSIVYHNFSHAYLFEGPRGTGKTSLSKIFARTVNCLSLVDGEACGQCSNCLSSFANECVDIIEIDAASNNGVDEIRELRNNVNLLPASLKYKVYIIDEVHMLSNGAFNALLKTLEEPPEHVIFILATTDPQKIPDTIISRCQTFSFYRISTSVIVDQLKLVSKEEKIDVEEEVLQKIAELSNGGLRDSLGMLDKLISFSNNEKITYDLFAESNGILTLDELQKLLNSVLNKDISSTISQIKTIHDSGKNIILVMSQFLLFLRDCIVSDIKNNIVDKNNFDIKISLINLLNEKMFDIKKSDNPRIYIEVLFIKFITDLSGSNPNILDNPVVDKKNDSDITEKVENIKMEKNGNFIQEERLSNESSSDSIDKNIVEENKIIQKYPKSDDLYVVPLNIHDIMEVRLNNTFVNADKSLKESAVEKFKLLEDYSFDQEVGYLINLLLDSKICVVSDEYIVISYDYDSIVRENMVYLKKFNDIYNKITDSHISFVIISNSEWNQAVKQFMEYKKDGKKFILKEEPEELFEEKNDDIISNSAVDLFGDIVQIEN